MSTNLMVCSSSQAAAALVPLVSTIVRRIVMPIAMARDPERTGCWFSFWRSNPTITDEAEPVVGFPVGLVSGERFRKYQWFANEKDHRLSQKLRSQGHFLSWQSQDESDPDPMKHQYGGAIAVRPSFYQVLFFSTSGFSAHEDEMVCTCLAYELGYYKANDVNKVFMTSGNKPLENWWLTRA